MTIETLRDLIIIILVWRYVGPVFEAMGKIWEKFCEFIRQCKIQWQQWNFTIKKLDGGIFDGHWMSNAGYGTATGPDGKFDLQMIPLLRAEIRNTEGVLGRSFMTLTASANWNVYQKGKFIRACSLTHEKLPMCFEQVATNTWQYIFPSGESRITFTPKSNTTLRVKEEGNFGYGNNIYQYATTYTMEKFNPDKEKIAN